MDHVRKRVTRDLEISFVENEEGNGPHDNPDGTLNHKMAAEFYRSLKPWERLWYQARGKVPTETLSILLEAVYYMGHDDLYLNPDAATNTTRHHIEQAREDWWD